MIIFNFFPWIFFLALPCICNWIKSFDYFLFLSLNIFFALVYDNYFFFTLWIFFFSPLLKIFFYEYIVFFFLMYMYKFFFYIYSVNFFFPFWLPSEGGCPSPGACWAYPRAGSDEDTTNNNNVYIYKGMQICPIIIATHTHIIMKKHTS